MIRTFNFALIAFTGLVCLGLYHIAEEARVAQAELVGTRQAIARERDTLTVLGAEWARLTQPARIQALAARHLELADKPEAELSALKELPRKGAPLVPGVRNAKAIAPPASPAPKVLPVSLKTGA
jgi:hypothetical protein